MRKMNRIFTLAIILFLLVPLLSLGYPTISATVSTVTVPDDFSSIQSAIDHATEGSTVCVRSGTYKEQTLRINKTLSIFGENWASTMIILDPPLLYRGMDTATGATLYTYDNCIDINAANVTFSGFTICSKTSGEFFVSGSGTIISQNNITINIRLCNNCQTISRNVINKWLTCVGGNHILIEKNFMMGAWCTEVTELEIRENIFESGGIALYSEENSVYNNTIKNGQYGITLATSNNRIVHNNFVNNSVQVEFAYNAGDLKINTWDSGYPLGGNYWSDYSGTDRNGDGIGDQPYIINEYNKDNFPLFFAINIADINGPLATTTASPTVFELMLSIQNIVLILLTLSVVIGVIFLYYKKKC